MINNSFPYLCVIFTYSILSYFEFKVSGKDKRLIRVACFIIYVVFFGASDFIGSDWYNYKYMYEEIELGLLPSGIEFGFLYMMKLSVFLGFSFLVFKFILFFLQGLLLDAFLSAHSRNISLFYVFFISLSPLLIIDAYRNLTSILIVLYGVRFLLRQKIFYFLFFIFLGALFHLTAILFVFLIFMYKNYYSRFFLVLICCVFLLYAMSGFNPNEIISGSLFYPSYSLYFNDIKEYGLRFGVFEKLVLLVFFILMYRFIKKKVLLPPVFFNGTVVYFLMYLFGYQFDFIIERLSLLFIIFYILTLVNFVVCLDFYVNKVVFLLAFLPLAYVKAFITFDKPIYKYSTVFFSDISEYERELTRYIYYYNEGN